MKKIITLIASLLLAMQAFTNLTIAQAPSAATATASSTPSKIVKDCPYCPEMVVIPAGSFVMGSDLAEGQREGVPAMMSAREQPLHTVTIRSFAIGRTEITRELYARFAEQDLSVEKGRECGLAQSLPAAPSPGPNGPGATPGAEANHYVEAPFDPDAITKKNWRNPGFVQSNAEPAVCVSYNDAKKFVAWLSKQTGKNYRLPTEAEWEYSARGGTTTSRYWGNDWTLTCKNANIASFAYMQATHSNQRMQNELLCNSDHIYTLPVGGLTANPFGLYDVLGNVMEVVEGCAHPDYKGAPADGSAWDEADCKIRNWRGGSHANPAWMARAATRVQQTPNYRNPDFGLRVARDLTN